LKKTYNMFTGTTVIVEIRFKNHLINPVIDKFGVAIKILKDGEDHFKIRTEVNISDGFIAWLFIFGDAAEVITPPTLRKRIKDKLEGIQKLYK
jgi:predicted DNA-binding transcriptional regulator YafY